MVCTLRIVGYLTVLGACVLLAACGGSNETTGSATASPTQSTAATGANSSATRPPAVTPDPCSLLTKAEVEAALGAPISEPTQSGIGTPNVICDFRGQAQTGVLLLVNNGSTSAGAKRIFDASRRDTYPEVAGLGESAYWQENSGGIHVLKGSFVVNLDVRPPAGKDRLAFARELATKVLVRLT